MPLTLTDVNLQLDKCSNGDVETSINPSIYKTLDSNNRLGLCGVRAIRDTPPLPLRKPRYGKILAPSKSLHRRTAIFDTSVPSLRSLGD